MMERSIVVTVFAGIVACDSGGGSAQPQGGTESGTSGTSASSVDPTGEGGGEDTTSSASAGDTSSEDGGETTAGTGADSGLPPGEGCCEAHEGAGCNEQAVAVCVCAESPECCVFDWLESCAELAATGCEASCESDESGGTDTGAMACTETVLMQLGAGEASLSGNWQESTSQAGEGQIIVIDPDTGVDGEVRWDIDVPCDDTWIIWVRLFDQGADDSFFANLDGEPSPPAIFEGGIAGPGQGWNWRQLNWRDSDDPATFIEDPWSPQWTAGVHSLGLSFRESIAVARIEVTNDPEYAP